MPTYLHPGVYIEEIPSGAKPIEGVSTSVTAFIGEATRGPAGEANLIGKLDDYVNEYGRVASEDDQMGLAVQAFYLNGGGAAYICRLAGADSTAASTDIAGEAGPDTGLIVSANSVGEWGNGIYVQVIKPDLDALAFDLVIGRHEDGEFVEDERFTGLTMAEDDDSYALTQVNDVSQLIELALDTNTLVNYQSASISGGELDTSDDDTFINAFASAQTMTLEINGLGARQITVSAPAALQGSAGLGYDADAGEVATAIQDAVRALSTGNAYQNFGCNYVAGPPARFTLTSPTGSSNSSLQVYGGTLATLLRLDTGATAVLTGGVLDDTDATLFSDGAAGLPSLADAGGLVTLDLTIDGQSASILLDIGTMSFSDNHAADGAMVAATIADAVRVLDLNVPAFAAFSCSYSGTRFVLTSGSANARNSGLSVAGGAGTAASLLGLDAGTTLVAGRDVEQGTANVIPAENLGLLDQGIQLTGGTESSPTAADYASFYGNVLRKVRDVSIIVLPGQPWPEDGSANPIVSQTLAHCSAMRNRMLILDPPEGFELPDATTVAGLALPTTTYNVLYYPWVEVANPLYNVDTNPTAPKTVTIAPSAFAAGMWAKIDGKRGVWKAPAGVETQLNGVAALEFDVEDLEQDQLNPLGVNCIRRLPNFGSVFWGTRTGATKADPEWRYVPVRRTAIFIEQSIFNGIQWAVFEPNDEPLWSSLRVNIGAFMDGLFRAGAFQGGTANDAYFVRCGLGDTMTQGDIDAGQVIVIVGFAPLKPAEFVIVRIQQKVGEQ